MEIKEVNRSTEHTSDLDWPIYRKLFRWNFINSNRLTDMERILVHEWYRNRNLHFKEFYVEYRNKYFKCTYVKSKAYNRIEYDGLHIRKGEQHRVSILKYYYKVYKVSRKDYLNFYKKGGNLNERKE